MTAPVVVNKQQLASWLGVSLPTLSGWMLRYGTEFPVIERGSNGREFKFDAAAVSAFLRARKAEQEASKVETDAQLAQLRLPFDLPGVEPPPRASSTKEELLAWELRKRQRQEAEAAGALVPAQQVGEALRAAFARIGRDTAAFVRQLARENNWPPAYAAQTERRLAEQQQATIAALRASFATPPAEPARVAH